jgi:bis(5'-nucleosidyl)-tetraphosphatase
MTRSRNANQRSAGVVVVRRFGERWRYLLLRAFRSWDFPKGGIEPGEQPIEAAVREVEEETGLTQLDFRWGQDYRETEPYAGGKIARYYVAVAPRGKARLPVNPALGRPEHHEFRWVELDAARLLVPPRLAPVLAWASTVVEPERVPG